MHGPELPETPMSLHETTLHAQSGRRCLVVEPYFQTPAVETGLEIAGILARKNEVIYLGPDQLKCRTDEDYRVTTRILHALTRKRWVSRYRRDGVQTLRAAELASLRNKDRRTQLATFLDAAGEDLGTATYQNFDLGQAVRSSMISVTRDLAWVASASDPFTHRLSLDALLVYELTRDLIRQRDIDLVLLFNGRMAAVRAVRRAAEAHDVQWWSHERGATFDKYAIYDGATSHLPSHYRTWVDNWWGWIDDAPQRAREFVQKRRQGSQTNWFAFTRHQEQGHIPPRDERRRIVYFTSSEDEVAAIGDDLRPDSPLCQQEVAIQTLGEACREAGHELIVRFHPNTPDGEFHSMTAARQAADTVCGPSSKVDTYALMDSADVVFTHNSTAGLEAAAVGKPAFSTGRNIYEDCASMRRIKTPQEMADALNATEGFDTEDAYRYFNYLAMQGIPYRDYAPRGLLSGSYGGKDLNFPLSTLRDFKVRQKRGRG